MINLVVYGIETMWKRKLIISATITLIISIGCLAVSDASASIANTSIPDNQITGSICEIDDFNSASSTQASPDADTEIPFSEWAPYGERYAVIVMGGPAHTQQQYGYYWMDTSGMYQELRDLGFTDENIYFVSWGDSAVENPEIVDRIGCSLSIDFPGDLLYLMNDDDFITTPFSLTESATAYSLAMTCLDDNLDDPSDETCECAITSDAEGNNVLTSAQVTADFKNDATCVGHRYVFNFAGVELNANTTYYLRTKVISGAPVRAWGGATLYHQSCLLCDCGCNKDNAWTGCMKDDVQWAFNQVEQHSTKDDLVYIFWVDHGDYRDDGFFYLPGNNITHAEVNNCIKDIEAKVIIGAYNPCYSGGVINDVSRTGVISTTSVNDSQTNAFGWAGVWRTALTGGTQGNPSDTNDDGHISMAEAYEWVAPKSQAYRDWRHPDGEHPWFDDNGDDVGSEYNTAGYDSANPNKDGYIGTEYSLSGYRYPTDWVMYDTGNFQTGCPDRDFGYSDYGTSMYAYLHGGGSVGTDVETITMEKTFSAGKVTRLQVNYLIKQMTDGDAWGGMAVHDRIYLITHDSQGEHAYSYIVAGATTNKPGCSYDFCCEYPNTKYINWTNQEMPAPGHGELEPPLDVWYTLDRDPDADFNIDWSSVSEVTIRITHGGGYLRQDTFETYFDNIRLTISPPAFSPWAYDESEDGVIQKIEAIHAIQDYFGGGISKAQVIEVVMLYFD